MNDILAQVATNTESQKNAGNAILYVQTERLYNIQCSEIFTLRKSYILRPDIFTLNFNVTLSGTSA